MFENLAETFQYRALLSNLISRELKVRYRGSIFGFLWTFLNPLMLMGVYSLVFTVYMRNSMANYTYFMFVGLLPWLWFSTSIISGTSAISDRRDLITKVKFPPHILPLTVIGSALMNYVFTLPLLIVFAWIDRIHFGLPLLAFPLVMLVQLLLSVGLVYITASINVVFRDLQHIIANLVTFAFFLTPIIYEASAIPERYRELAMVVNPLAALMASYQDIFFYNRWPAFRYLGNVAGVAVLFFALGCGFMRARREDFAETA
jgi:lipopolysaccharide transport system permease protein